MANSLWLLLVGVPSVLLIVCLCALAYFKWVLMRNDLVYEARVGVLKGPDGLSAYYRLPDYDTMLCSPRAWPNKRLKELANTPPAGEYP